MSKILVDTIDTRSGTSTLTLGSSNAGTIALGSGDVQSNFNQPYFRGYMNGDQEVSTATLTTIQINTVVFQTGSTFNTGTYIWTPAVAGKYYIYAKMAFNETADFDFDEFGIRTTEENEISRSRGGNIRKDTFVNEVIADLSATEGVYLTCYQQTGSSQTINGNSLVTTFGGFRIGT